LPEIRFGTDGWRGIIAEDFTFANLKKVAFAIANYALKEDACSKGIIVGHDCRFLSEQFSATVASVLKGFGLKVYVVSEPLPTPAMAALVLNKDAFGAIMLTASHNPFFYHGLKFIPFYGGPATPEITSTIEGYLQEEVKNELALEESGWEIIDNPRQIYFSFLEKMLQEDVFFNNPLKVVIDPLYGSGSGYLEDYLQKKGWKVVSLHTNRDPFFGGGIPEPKEEILKPLVEKVKEENASLGLALDGDADRFGIIDEKGNFVAPNTILAILYYHLLQRRNLKGGVARTVATTHALDRLADYYGYEIVETPVGFKYIAQALLQGNIILGGEESGGMSIKGHIPEKDGILACLLVAEAVAASGKSLNELKEELFELIGPFYSQRWDIAIKEESSHLKNILKDYAPAKLQGRPVMEHIVVDGTKLVLADGSWVLIRPSGTEPVVRIYIESSRPDLPEKIKSEVLEDLKLV
jgi:phosphomannomutase